MLSLLDSPRSVVTRAFLGTLRSSSFLATFVVIFQSLVCLQRNVYTQYSGKVPDWVMNVVLHKSYYWFSGPCPFFLLFSLYFLFSNSVLLPGEILA